MQHKKKKGGVTIKDIAMEAGISYATVSRALNNRPGVKKATRSRVLEVSKRLGYYPNAAARSLVTSQTRALALVIPDITNPFFPEVARGVEETVSKADYNVFLCNTNWDGHKELSFLALFESRRIDGLILASSNDDGAIAEKFAQTGVPLVVISSFERDIGCHQVIVDNVWGGYLAGRHLLEHGYDRIAFIGGLAGARATTERFSGFEKALAGAGLKADPGLCLYGSFTWESGYRNALKLLALERRPNAIFAANDLLAMGIMQAADELGLSISDDLALIGFDDIGFASYPRICLTTIAQPKKKLGEAAAEIILADLGSERKEAARKIVLTPELVIRRSCGCY
ncbi:MAG: LacI family DNA-binding transcriptional regulator [Bacillota bacterium]|nr:LacI family DNA-binding transcriptional regulator [Bacillota bacterium]